MHYSPNPELAFRSLLALAQSEIQSAEAKEDQLSTEDAGFVDGLPALPAYDEDSDLTDLDEEEEPQKKRLKLDPELHVGVQNFASRPTSLAPTTSSTDPRFNCDWDSDLSELDGGNEVEEVKGQDEVQEEEEEEGEVQETEAEREAARGRALARQKGNARRNNRRKKAVVGAKVKEERLQAEKEEGEVIPHTASGDYYGRMKARLIRLARHKRTLPTSNDLPHSTKGYVGTSTDQPPPEAPAPGSNRSSWPDIDTLLPHDDPRYIKLRKARDEEYGYATSEDALTTVTDAEGCLPIWRTSQPRGTTAFVQEQRTLGFNRAIEQLGRDLDLIDARGKCKRVNRFSRGPFACAQFGTSFGNGQPGPTSFDQTEAKRNAWKRFVENPFVQSATDFVTDSFRTWAPKLFVHYNDTRRAILSLNAALDRIAGKEDSPFMSMTVNFGPQTVCRAHRDTKNLAYGLCAIVVGGDFDHRVGGHLILHEFRLVVEMRAGDTLFLPSAVVTHQNIPIGPNETRTSVVYYSAGGLFRWVVAGNKTHTQWKKDDPEAYAAHEELGEARWKQGWNMFMKI